MTEIVKVMLASSIKDYDKITYPKFISPKLDGIRCIINNGVVYSRSGKPIRSKIVQQLFGRQDLNMLDGELIYDSPTADNVFNLTTSFVMSEDIPDGMDASKIKLYVFDYVDDEQQFSQRNLVAGHLVEAAKWHNVPINLVVQTCINSYEEMLTFEQQFLAQGYEGAMLRNIHGLYKHGRATEKSQALMKVKRFEDDEALIIGVEELMHNANVQTKGVFGNSERSSHKENLVPVNTLGALVCATKDGVIFNIGTGYTQKMRDDLWKMYKDGRLVGEYVKYKSFKIGVVNAPRLPVYKEIIGLRMKEDIS